MHRILFVDDEPSILAGIRQSLRKERKLWNMEFCEGGAAAITRLGEYQFDVLVTDMRMPQVDGIAVLEHARLHHPATIRIVLSGYSEHESSIQATSLAHQFLSKPCPPETLRATLARALTLRGLLDDAELREMVGGISVLAPVPATFNQLCVLCASADTSALQVAALIEEDPGLSAKILQVVNSAFFGLARQTSDIERAVNFIGLALVRHLVLLCEAFARFDRAASIPARSLRSLQQRALSTGHLARSIIRSAGAGESMQADAMLAGAMAEIGQIVLAGYYPERWANVNKHARANDCTFYAAERSLYRHGYPEIGGYLLGLWGLPCDVVEAVINHVHPQRVDDSMFGVTTAVHVATALVNERAARTGGPEPPPLDVEHLRHLTAYGKLATWRQEVDT